MAPSTLPTAAVASEIDNQIKTIINTGQRSIISRCLTKRAVLRDTNVSNIIASIDSDIASNDLATIESLQDYIETTKKELEEKNAEIEDGLLSSENPSQDIYADNYKTVQAYIHCLTLAAKKAKIAISNLREPATPQRNGNNQNSFHSLASMPKLELPKFHSDPMDYISFINRFDTLIEKCPSYDEFQKFSLLEQSLVGEAKSVIRASGVRNMTYTAARSALDKAYKDAAVQESTVITHLMNLKMNSKEPYAWLNKVNQLKEESEALRMTPDSFLNHFAWNSLPSAYKIQIVNITGKTKPELQDVINNFHQAQQRLRDLKSSTSPQKNEYESSVSMSGTTESDQSHSNVHRRVCLYCDSPHQAKNCKQYAKPEDKVKRLKQLHRCEKCAQVHKGKCNIKETQLCKKCDNPNHTYYLCVSKKSPLNTGKSEPPETRNDDSVVESTSSSLTVVSCSLAASKASNVILPSVTATVEAKDGCKTKVRAFVDSCSQNTLISEKLANELQLETKEDMTLSLQGMNNRKSIRTRRVNLPVILNNKRDIIPAIVLPKIDINLKLSGIKFIVEKFAEKGYKLADESLANSDSLRGDILLGSDQMRLLSRKSMHFGNSSCVETQLGIMLEGNIDHVLLDLNSLEQKA